MTKILLDTPAEGALAMGFEELARAFAGIIHASEPRFAIGLFGSWGSGKTTLMHAIRTELERAQGGENAIVWFAAWRYEKEEHLIIPLLDTIREAVLEWARHKRGAQAREQAITLAKTIGDVTRSLVSGLSLKFKVPGFAEASFDANKAIASAEGYDEAAAAATTPRSTYHASFLALRNAFAQFQAGGAKRIVIFVDDLDRCLPEGALEVLESMKLFFDLSGFVFVVGIDAPVVERFVEHRYRDLRADGEDGAGISGQAYLRKMFQVPFGLRPVVGRQIDEFIEATISVTGMEPDQETDLRQLVKPFLAQLVTEQGFNPRELKRFINAYTIQRMIRSERMVVDETDARLILALQTIAFRADWAAVNTALLAFGEALVEVIEAYVAQPDGARDASVFVPFLGAQPPPSFLDFLLDNDTGLVLSQVRSQFKQIEDFLFEGASLGSDAGTRTGHVEAFLAIGRAIGKLTDLDTTMELNRALPEIRGVLSSLE